MHGPTDVKGTLDVCDYLGSVWHHHEQQNWFPISDKYLVQTSCKMQLSNMWHDI